MDSIIYLSSPSQKILYFPVRHHSPGCSFHLKRVMEDYHPDCILVEGPKSADKLIGVLTDQGTVPPVAFYYFYKDTAKYVSDDGDDYKCYYPFLRCSPEYTALRFARENGIDCSFMDLPYGDILINTAEEKGLRRKKEISSYTDDHYLSDSKYFEALCEKSGVRCFDEFWEKYFETDALNVSTGEYIRRMYTYCYITRKNTPYEEMLRDGCLVRESFMADNIKIAARSHSRVLVVTGGFHSYGLYQLLEGRVKPLKYKLHKLSEKVQDVYAMNYSFEAADALSGYSSGMQNPGFYDSIWQAMNDGTDISCVYEKTMLDTLLRCTKACIKEKLPVTMADVSSAVAMYQGLAKLRGKHSPGLYELYDSVRSCYIKGEVNPSSDLPLRLLGKAATGNETGRLCDSAEKIPILQDFEESARRFKLKTDTVMEQQITLELFSKPVHRQISSLFYQMNFLDCGFAKRLKGADLISGKDRSRIREQWSYKRTAGVDAALIDASAYGGTVAEACTVLSLRRLRDAQKCSEGAKLYVECFLMGINTTDGFAGRMEDIIIADGDFFSVGQGLYYFNMLSTLQELYSAEKSMAVHFLRKCFYKAVSMLPNMMNVTEDRANECIRICRLLYSLVSKELSSDEYEILKDTFAIMIQKPDPEPSLFGAVLGLLYGFDSGYRADICMFMRAYMSGSKEMQKQGAAFLRGLFSTARDIVLVGDEFVKMTDTLISSFDMEDFMEVLPELRLAFSFFSPSETDNIAKTAASLHGGNAQKLLRKLPVYGDVYAVGVMLEKEILTETGWNND